MVIWLITSFTAPNQARVRLGLKAMRTTASTGSTGSAR